MTTPKASVQRPFAAFDIDGTVIRWQLYHAVVHELSRMKVIPEQSAAQIRQARLTWKQRQHQTSFHDYESTLVEIYHQARHHIRSQDFDTAVEHVFETYKDQVYTFTRDLIRDLKAKDYLLFAISGSQQEIVEKFGAYYGFDAMVGSKHARTDDGRIGESTSSPIMEGKGPVLQALIQQYGATTTGSYAVGDSGSDAAMLELVEHPIAFNPDNNLLATAKSHGWEIVVERKNVIYHLKKSGDSYQLRG
jgi:HAD superfamily hydrolase (TIGR01490 family)